MYVTFRSTYPLFQEMRLFLVDLESILSSSCLLDDLACNESLTGHQVFSRRNKILLNWRETGHQFNC